MKRPKPPLNIVVVEDEPLIAMDMEMMVEDAGHKVIAEAASLYDAQSWDNSLNPDIAFVDIQLARQTSGLDVSKMIQVRWPQTIIVFVTANPKIIPEDFGGAHGVIPKPLSQNGFLAAMKYLQEGVCDPPPTVQQPNSFTASPAFAATWYD
ncbi:response regulator [Agrobacterium larrymoorei]|uniref:Response regulator n=1 Tax=Agrobacterium larrymoorei TaxID=160699 RepID=A0A4D7DYN7_9HYPH|nr:response regulator [Agrobacterium larrymoorei]QCI99276.1 response regulator [Agrobacterium larrymoorei]QYA08812.1 response regulator [Agrobacterium larrymoorei]